MKEQQKEQALNKLEYFFNENNSDFIQINNAILSAENKTIKCLLIVNALDMISQYYSGELKNNRTSKRLINLFMEFGDISAKNAEILFQFRNALCHHFGTFSFNNIANKKYRFKINSDENSLIIENDKLIEISEKLLEKLYLKSITSIKNKFVKDEKHLTNFIKVYRFIHTEK